MATSQLRVLVLAGGPDRERPVSLISGGAVADALRKAGHDVRQRDIAPNDLTSLDEFKTWPGHVIFPVLHGAWGEGGGLQQILEQRRLPYVGCRATAADLCMDKLRTKQTLAQHHLPTAPFEVLTPTKAPSMPPPYVIKAIREGSSIDLVICRDSRKGQEAHRELSTRHQELLLEKFVKGKELTVGVLANGTGAKALPPIHIIPATEYYDYSAKYDRDDTQYLFDIDLPPAVLTEVQRVAVETFNLLGCRHMARVDMIVDQANQPWVLEVNTIPGFTSHSLLPKAAAHAGMPMPQLVDYLARLALAE